MDALSSRLLALLQRPPTASERAAIADWQAQIDHLAASLEQLPPSAIDAGALTRARIETSNTLRPTARWPSAATLDVRRAWAAANDLVVGWVAADERVHLEGIRQVNAKLSRAQGASPFRTGRPRLDQELCVPPEDVEPLLGPMLAAVEQRLDEDGALAAAALLYQWLVSVHPFEDANGRTSRLAADWLLGLHGYVPVSFAEPFDGFVVVFPAHPEPRTLGHAAGVIAKGVMHTLAVLSGTAAKS